MHPQHTREIVSPQWPDLVLAAHVPDVELGVLVGHSFDVEAHGRDGRHILVQLELVEDCCTRKCQYMCIYNHAMGMKCLEGVIRFYALVLPAASSPSISSRISLEPKMRFIIFDICPPMMAVVCVCGSCEER